VTTILGWKQLKEAEELRAEGRRLAERDYG